MNQQKVNIFSNLYEVIYKNKPMIVLTQEHWKQRKDDLPRLDNRPT